MSENNTVVEHDVELGKFKVLAPIEFTDETGKRLGDLEVGSIQEVPVDLGNSWVEQGLAEVFTLEEESAPVLPVEEEGPVLESNEYVLKGFKGSEDVVVEFYEMNEDGTTKEGTSVEALIQVAITRLTELNNRFASDFSKNAISHLTEALAQLNERTRDRVARGVEGTHQA